jgi:CubicO group peptidase (beta-lactamase class C family)
MNPLFLLLLLLPFLASSQDRKPTNVKTVHDKLGYFLNLTDTLRQRAHNPGLALAIIWEGKVLYQGGMGYRDVAKKLPVTNNTLFEIGSCSKAFTGVLAAQLVRDSLLHWHAPVRHYVKEFRLADDYATLHATLQDLLTHRVGLYQHYYLQYGPRYNRAELLAKLPYLSFNGTFREKFIYNNLLYAMAGLVEERVTHTPWEKLVDSRIFQPLGMRHSFATFEDFQRYPENTVSYEKDGRTVVAPMSLDAVAPAGGISSTIEDMALWVKMLVNKGTLDGLSFLTPQQFAYLTSPLTVRNAAEEIFYGIAWDIDTKRNIIYHDGRTAGQSCRILLMPQQGFGIVMLCNQQTDLQNLLIRYATNILVDNNYERMADFEQFVQNSAKHADPAPVGAPIIFPDQAGAQELPAYVGTYTHPAYGRITLSQHQPQYLSFAYYDFKGPVQSRAEGGFSAFTSHYTGNDVFNFRMVKDIHQVVKGLEITFPYAQPLLFTKEATHPPRAQNGKSNVRKKEGGM